MSLLDGFSKLLICVDVTSCYARSRMIAIQKASRILFLFCAVHYVDSSHSQSPRDEFNYEMADIAQGRHMPTEYLLNAFGDMLQPRVLPQLNKETFGVYHPKRPRNRLLFRKTCRREIIIVPLPESFLLLQAQSLMFGLEELTRGLRNLYRTEKSTIWLCFAMKIFFDINHFHRAESGKAFDELKAIVHAAKIRLHQMISVTARLSRAPNGMMIRFETPHFRRRMDYQRRT
jgi:hypothetical protein